MNVDETSASSEATLIPPDNNRANSREVSLKDISAIVHRIHIDGLQRTRADIVVKQVKQLFAAENFAEVVSFADSARQQLEQLGLCKSCAVHIDVDKGENAKPNGYDVTYTLKESRRLTGGISTLIGTNEGSLLLSARLPNAIGRGEKVSLDYTYGSKNAVGWSLSFQKPLFGNVNYNSYILRIATPRLPKSRFYHLFDKEFVKNNSNKKHFNAGLFQNSTEFTWSGYKQLDRGLASDISVQSGKNSSHTIRWEGVWRDLSCLSRSTAFSVREQCGPNLKSSVKHTWTYDTRDSRVLPNVGHLIKVSNEIAGLGGDASFIKHEIELQANKMLTSDCVLQLSLAGGLVNPYLSNRPISIMDRVFLGGPLTFRGFHIKGIGPHEDGCALGADAYWIGGLHLYTPLPFRPGKGGFGEYFRTHFFVNTGNIANCGGPHWMNNLTALANNVRLSYGAGVVLRLGGIARLELNYCVPVRAATGDKVNKGFQFGVGISFL